MDAGYVCKECRKPVSVIGERITRTCEHKTTILAIMTANAVGHGGVSPKGKSWVSRTLESLLPRTKTAK